jgi:hypothetical protein
VRDIFYDKDLTDVWFEYLKPYNGTQMTFNELYRLYNKYNAEHAAEIRAYVRQKYRLSNDKLSKIYPYHFKATKKTNVKTAGGNKLRSIGNEIFVTNKIYESDEYITPISTQVRKSIDKEFDETSGTRGQILGAMRNIAKSGDDRFDYEAIINNKNDLTLDELRKYGAKSNTAYIRFDKVYHMEYGNINPARLNNILKSRKI